MASPPTSRLRFVTHAGEALDAPPEWTPCRLEIDAAPTALELEAIRIYRGDEPLEVALAVVDGTTRLIAEWPRAGAGGYRLRLELPEGAETLDCTVRPQKLSMAAFERLLEDLQRRLPATIAIALQKAGALAGLTIIQPQETTLPEELNRLTRACRGTESRRGLADTLRAIARQPHRILQAMDVWTRREQARRIDPTRLYQAFARRENLTENLIPLHVPEKRVEHTVDVYENRLLRAFYDQVNMRLRALVQDAARVGDVALAEQATALLDELGQARREARFLDEVGELTEPPARLTMVLLKRSEYRSALEGFLEFRRSAVVQLDEPFLVAPLTNLPKLYERWGTLEVIAAFLALAEPLGYKVKRERLVARSAGRVWVEVLRDGRPAVELVHANGQTAKLIPQRTYSATGSGMHSISFAKRPDVAIEITRPDGACNVWIFDPKYKLDSETAPTSGSDEADLPAGTPKPQDINAMHAYRDAIRDGSDEHIVRVAAILYPGPSRFYGHDVAALQAQPLDPQLLAIPLAKVLGAALATPNVVSAAIDKSRERVEN
jgi:hypothetical protein